MVKHIILWKLNDGLSPEEQEKAKTAIKQGLEGLMGQIPGLKEIVVRTCGLASSNADLMLDSTFEDEAALKGYAIHPKHVDVATHIVRPSVKIRLCMDYEL